MRGYMKSGHSNADEQRAARVILKDYMNGKLLFCHPPPGMSEAEFNRPVHVAKLNELRASKRTARMVGDIVRCHCGKSCLFWHWVWMEKCSFKGEIGSFYACFDVL